MQYYVLVSGTLTKMEVTKSSGPEVVAAWCSVFWTSMKNSDSKGFGVGQSTAGTCLAVKPCNGFVRDFPFIPTDTCNVTSVSGQVEDVISPQVSNLSCATSIV